MQYAESRDARELPDNEFLADVILGLSQDQKTLSPKYFYDQQGSEYFDEICDLQEYYPYRTELAMLPTVAQDLGNYFTGNAPRGLEIVEFGAGSLRKVGALLRSLQNVRSFTAIDISEAHLISACRVLESQYRELSIHPCVHDFTKPLSLHPSERTRLGFFPGSTIGNFTPQQASVFLRNAGTTLGTGSFLLIGVDTQKPPTILNQAYNDPKGITAKFNKNVLERINRELDGNFKLHNFAHHAFYNETVGRIEMHLRSLKEQQVNIAGHTIEFSRGESIHTENSYKFKPDDFTELARQSGWVKHHLWLDSDKLFAVYLLQYAH
ncbi:L-histidine N(alpha)-methyltransferase [Gilvimarinus agarilyticus]|uniref:L-histidine N(alpha)-methyltransferase n=1 Tax=unclassified Gilvimarinus TaxID=2642066 RepID=UPI001C090147|nr:MULTISPECIES: L-histidine N(alpha)-methyltransferase [unclassified Gilvimarinus]MBU2887326.1 L-histidine N(alpha)-methyltransferase [Gilvimarinus agarilyticus]MDO6571985.1 L-histidine N(alpha)-methyltransferase [Gilvimarinus sp. 2_MG-2023]MDO6746053.1 L-histidine N(alpha)-methyltransferase [Gilvimarinus sp. 1_MG-2023]